MPTLTDRLRRSGASVTLQIAAGQSATPANFATGGVQLEPIAPGSTVVGASAAGFIVTDPGALRPVTINP